MPLVSIREVRTFREAAAQQPKRSAFNVLHIAGVTRRELAQDEAMIAIHNLGLLWNFAATRFDIRFALSVAEAHTDIKKAYGMWGEMMTLAGNVRQRLVRGLDLMAAHADDSRWGLEVGKDIFRLARKWHYPNTSDRAEAFAAISELREWLIVMQRHVLEQIQPLELQLPEKFLSALRPDEREFLGGFFGCKVTEGISPSLLFSPTALFFNSRRNDPGKFLHLQEQLREGLLQKKLQVGFVPPTTLKLSNGRAVGDLDARHGAVLQQAALDAADYIAPLAAKDNQLSGVDIGAGDLKVTEIFLRHLKAKNPLLGVEMVAVDPVLKNLRADTYRRKAQLKNDLGIPVIFEGKEWEQFEKDLPGDKKFHFVVSFQTFSFMSSEEEVRQTYRTIANRLVPGGRLFAAFEPYDKSTLVQYQGLPLQKRSVEFHRECGIQAGLEADLSFLYPAHGDESKQVFACARFRK